MRASGAPREAGEQPTWRQEDTVQVAARSVRDGAVIAWVDVVGTHLERLYPLPAADERGQEGARDRGLPNTAREPGYDETTHPNPGGLPFHLKSNSRPILDYGSPGNRGVLLGAVRCLVACSYAYPSLIIAPSLYGLPRKVIPTGSASDVNPAGTEIEGT